MGDKEKFPLFNTQIYDGGQKGETTANFRGNQGYPTSDPSHRPTHFLSVLLRVDWGGSLVNNVCGIGATGVFGTT